eukprot:Opistho-2@89369
MTDVQDFIHHFTLEKPENVDKQENDQGKKARFFHPFMKPKNSSKMSFRKKLVGSTKKPLHSIDEGLDGAESLARRSSGAASASPDSRAALDEVRRQLLVGQQQMNGLGGMGTGMGMGPHSNYARQGSIATSSAPASASHSRESSDSSDWALHGHGDAHRRQLSDSSVMSTAGYGRVPSHSGSLTAGNHAHSRSHSAEAGDDMQPLPDGWERALTADGHVYFIDHKSMATTWVDPRTKRPTPGTQQVPVAPAAAPSAVADSSALPTPRSSRAWEFLPDPSLSRQPLPPGWEQAITPDGVPYFINHNTRATTWVDPRTNIDMQSLFKRHMDQTDALARRHSHQPQSSEHTLPTPRDIVVEPQHMRSASMPSPRAPFGASQGGAHVTHRSMSHDPPSPTNDALDDLRRQSHELQMRNLRVKKEALRLQQMRLKQQEHQLESVMRTLHRSTSVGSGIPAIPTIPGGLPEHGHAHSMSGLLLPDYNSRAHASFMAMDGSRDDHDGDLVPVDFAMLTLDGHGNNDMSNSINTHMNGSINNCASASSSAPMDEGMHSLDLLNQLGISLGFGMDADGCGGMRETPIVDDGGDMTAYGDAPPGDGSLGGHVTHTRKLSMDSGYGDANPAMDLSGIDELLNLNMHNMEEPAQEFMFDILGN